MVDDHLQYLTHFLCLYLCADFLLQNHQFVKTALLHLSWNIILVVVGTISTLLLRISKGTHTLKALSTNEFEQFMEVFLSLTRETYHQSGADMNARHTLTDGLEQINGFLLAHVAMHSVEHIVADMLQGDVKILTYVWLLAHHIEQIERELVRISIVQTNPLHTRNIRHAADEFGDVMLAVQVHAVVGEFLGDNLEFLHTIGYQLAYLVEDFIHRTGNVLAGDDRNGAIRTAAVATFRNLDIGIMMRSSEMAGSTASRHISLAQFLEQLLIIKLTIKLIHLGHLSLQFLLVAL